MNIEEINMVQFESGKGIGLKFGRNLASRSVVSMCQPYPVVCKHKPHAILIP